MQIADKSLPIQRTKLSNRSRPLLQLAVDATDLQVAINLVGEVYPHHDITEIGTPLIIEEGLRALEVLKSRFPDTQYLADLKIMDAGHLEADRAFQRGADIVSVLALADDRTIQGALEAAEKHGGQIMVDLINVPDVVARVRQLQSLGVHGICIHVAHDVQGNGKDPMAALHLVRKETACCLAVAGGLKLENVDQAVSSGADILVFGSSLASHPDPGQLACEIIARMQQACPCDPPEETSREITTLVAHETAQCLQSVSPEQMDAAVEAIDGARRIFLAGAGRSGLVMRAFAMRLMHLGKTVHLVGDVTTPAIGEHDLLVIGSGSGNTAGLRTMAGQAKESGARILLFTIQPDSPMGRLAEDIVQIAAPSPKAESAAETMRSLQPMGSLFEQTLFLLCDSLVVVLMQKNDLSSEAMFTRHANLE